MRAVQIRTFGSPEGMELVEMPDPSPSAGEVAIGTTAIGVGGVDAMIRRGTLTGYGFQEGHVLGSEVAGEVTAVGDGVDPSWLGRAVWAFTGRGGGYVETALARVEDVIALPSGLSPVDSVTLGSSAPVAHFALERARLTAGESVLVKGASGSIGVAAVQLAAARGAQVAATTASTERGRRLRELGAAYVLDRDGVGEGPDSFDVIIDIVGGAGLPGLVDRLARNGRLVAVGMVGGLPPVDFGASLLRAFQRSVTFATLSLDTVPRADLARVRREQFEDSVRGDLATVVHDVVPLSDAAEAHRRMDAGEVFGRIVLTP